VFGGVWCMRNVSFMIGYALIGFFPLFQVGMGGWAGYWYLVYGLLRQVFFVDFSFSLSLFCVE
jgi:hypothetical protein